MWGQHLVLVTLYLGLQLISIEQDNLELVTLIEDYNFTTSSLVHHSHKKACQLETSTNM
jgi:hypothetical protein